MTAVNRTTHPKLSTEVVLHILAWLVIFFFPQMIFLREGDFVHSWQHSLRVLGGPVTLAIVFYTNYLWNVPRYLLTKKYRNFVINNIIIILLAILLMNGWMQMSRHFFPDMELIHHAGGIPRPHHHLEKGPWWGAVLMQVRDVMLYLLMCVLASILHMSKLWQEAELAREQAELGRSEAELQNLRNQLSPHFLLNTLNNIYALISFNQEKAQKAVRDLSRLLNHMLYSNHDSLTTLQEEIEFLQHYIELMKIRLADNFKLEVLIDAPEANQIRVAPLMFISLIENAFKHSISTTGEGFISIHLKATTEEILLTINNSNHPKTKQDRSGHGVGLQQVQRRLDLVYPGKYEWDKGVNADETIYHSILKIRTV